MNLSNVVGNKHFFLFIILVTQPINYMQPVLIRCKQMQDLSSQHWNDIMFGKTYNTKIQTNKLAQSIRNPIPTPWQIHPCWFFQQWWIHCWVVFPQLWHCKEGCNPWASTKHKSCEYLSCWNCPSLIPECHEMTYLSKDDANKFTNSTRCTSK